MTALTGYILLFVVMAVFFVFIHLLAGRFIRPVRPDPDKLTIYECGEPTIGSAWVQFDLRFYVVALLFVIFDVEVAFFFPWAVVFGNANSLASRAAPATQEEQERYNHVVKELVPPYPENQAALEPYQDPKQLLDKEKAAKNRRDARAMAWLAFWDILVFFGVLLVGFAYLWKRGDLDWVRSTAAERAASDVRPELPLPDREAVAVGAGKESIHI